ncbi:MAG: branched-chain amino acid transporter, partial [Burkholderiales bacterium PBB5]
MGTLETIVTIAGLVLITLLTRGFFVLPSRDLPMPNWLREG